MTVRSKLTGAQVVELHAALDHRLETVGLQGQPEVAIKLLDLANRPNSQLSHYAEVVKNDQAVSGRVLRLANSAFFAQRKPVSSIERACVVLGTDRLRAVALGYHLSRAAQAPGDRDYSRRIWGESLLRACLAAQLARLTAPAQVSEAFVVGLMMDAGLPLMGSLAGDTFRSLLARSPSPGRLFRSEFDTLPFTHVDVVVALCRRWRLPELLVKPIGLHHTRPSDAQGNDPLQRLHRIAYAVGLVELGAAGDASLSTATPGVATAQRLLSLSDAELTRAVRQTGGEYTATVEMFRDVASPVVNIDEVMDRIHARLLSAVDGLVELDLAASEADAPTRLTVGGQFVEVTRDAEGGPVAYVFDSHGNRIISHRFKPATDAPLSLCEALGIESAAAADLALLEQAMRRFAA
ncbi:MAG TPA: HDOD domain-containing protein [Phycisphaerales bacterium]|nr:HDOD domain-containing protein [Phycisphaerales bacterium]